MKRKEKRKGMGDGREGKGRDKKGTEKKGWGWKGRKREKEGRVEGMGRVVKGGEGRGRVG